MWAKYHVTDPDVFYNRNDEWNVAQDPGVGEPGSSNATADTSVGVTDQNTVPSSDRVDPTYLLTKLPGEKQESFLLLRPFVPTSGDNESKLLTAFMVAKSDPDDYGRLETFVMPPNHLPNGPSIVAGQMQSNGAVSELQTLLCQKGSKCELRNLLVIPIDNSLLYVRSFFVQDESNQIPELRKVIASYQDANNTPHVEVDDTLQGALKKLFGSSPATLEEPNSSTGSGKGSNNASNNQPSNDTTNQLIGKLVQAFDTANTALKKGDLVTYARQIATAGKYAKQLDTLRTTNSTGTGTGSPSGSGSSTTTTTTTTTTTPSDSTTTTTTPRASPTTTAGPGDTTSTTTTST